MLEAGNIIFNIVGGQLTLPDFVAIINIRSYKWRWFYFSGLRIDRIISQDSLHTLISSGSGWIRLLMNFSKYLEMTACQCLTRLGRLSQVNNLFPLLKLIFGSAVQLSSSFTYTEALQFFVSTSM